MDQEVPTEMPRLPHVGVVLDATAQKVAEVVDDAFEVVIEAISDGRITPEEDARIRSTQVTAVAAVDENCDAADRYRLAATVARSVLESLDGKRTRAAIKEWNGLTVIEGGLAAELGPGVA